MKSKHLALVQYKNNPSAYTFRVYREETDVETDEKVQAEVRKTTGS